jgi:hypothetical protein
MKTLFEIIDAAKSGEKPTHDECYWAMLALDALLYFESRAISQLANHPSKLLTPEFYYKESFNRRKNAYSKDPKTWVGPNNDPSSKEYQKRRAIGLKLFDKVINKIK